MKRHGRAGVALIMLTSALVASSPAEAAPSRASQRAAVRALLAGAHPTITRDHLRRIGPDVESILREAATGPDRGTQPAVRALALLGHFNSKPTVRLLRRTLGQNKLPLRLRRVAGTALLRSQGVAAHAEARAMLSHAESQLREAAAIALGGMPNDLFRRLLERRLANESEAFVRDAIKVGLRRHAAAAKVRSSRPGHR